MKLTLAVVFMCIALAAAKAPLLNIDSPTVIPGQYLVAFHLNSTVQIRDMHVTELRNKRFSHKDEKILHVFDIGTLIGYSARLSKETLAQELEHPNVRLVEADQEVHLVRDGTIDVPNIAPGLWGQARVTSRDKQTLPLRYSYWESAGDQVTAYVIDTGIQTTHVDFDGRAVFGASFITGEADTDLNGHGTHVAGTIGGTTYGLAKKVQLKAVKVLSSGGGGSWEGVVAGIDWVTKDHESKKNARSVANMSLGGGKSAICDEAVLQSVTKGVNHVVAAGNSNANACTFSPAGVLSAITVGSIDVSDVRSYFSNYGTCVDTFAPGSNILSAWIGSTNTATNTISGTSMASPHVAGVVALYLGHLLNTTSPDTVPPLPNEVEIFIKDSGTIGLITDPGTGSPNSIVYSQHSDVY